MLATFGISGASRARAWRGPVRNVRALGILAFLTLVSLGLVAVLRRCMNDKH